MKICAQDPMNPEVTLCGYVDEAYEDPVCDNVTEPFRHSRPGEYVNCGECLNAITAIQLTYTPLGKHRK